MSERDYLISKATKNMEEWKEGRKRAYKDPTFLAGAGAGLGGAGLMGHTYFRNADKVDNAERTARRAGKTGWQAIKPALKAMPKRFYAGGAASITGTAAMQSRNQKHQRDIMREGIQRERG